MSINVSLQIGLIRFIASSGKEPVLSFVLEDIILEDQTLRIVGG